MLTLLTTTGTRPEAFDLCQRYMMRQTFAGKVRWVIVDDGEEMQPLWFSRDNWTTIVLRPMPRWSGASTQQRNLIYGLGVVGYDERVVVIEDDDWYAPDWLETCARHLQTCELFGESRAIYYNVRTRVYRQLKNTRHASLCATAMRGRALQLFRKRCEENHHFIDAELWKRTPSEIKRLIDSRMVVGMKGLPGRGNLGIGERLSGQPDPEMARLEAVIGRDVDFYRAFRVRS